MKDVDNVRAPSNGLRFTVDEMAGYCAFVHHICGYAFLSDFVQSSLGLAAISDTHAGH